MTAASASPGPALPPPRSVIRLLAGWHWLEVTLALVAYSVILLLLMSDVLGRELVGPLMRLLGFGVGPTGVYGSQKLALYAMIIGVFLGLGIATSTGTHLLPRVGFAWFPKDWGPTIDRIADVVTGIVLSAAAWYAVVFVLSSRTSGLVMAVLGAPAWWIQAVIPAGLLSAALRYFIFALWPAARPRTAEFQE